ncbi:hypothetical protein ACQ4PT_051589 [Festuca glaucescens]
MGDRGGGGRFHGGCGGATARNPQGGGGGKGFNNSNSNNRPNVWHWDDGAGQVSGADRDCCNPNRDRWEAAADKLNTSNIVANQGGQGGIQRQGTGKSPVKAGNSDPCFNCNLLGQYAASCPTIRCSRCKKLGHIREICQAVIPWECNAVMCGFQSPSLGFFYFSDECDGKQTKEKASTIVISVLEGDPSFRDIEYEFNEYFGSGWRCTARIVGPKQYLMRFPNPKEVLRLVCIKHGSKLEIYLMKKDVRLQLPMLGHWLGFPWRLMGQPCTNLNTAVLIGCRNINELPETAEGVLGDFFYDFYYEIDNVVVGGQPRETVMISTDSRSAPFPKRARVETSSSIEPVSSSTGGLGADSQSEYRGGKSYAMSLATVSEHESEEDSEDDQELLIDQIMKERQHDDKNAEYEDSMEDGDNVQKSEVEVESDKLIDDNTMEKVVGMELDKEEIREVDAETVTLLPLITPKVSGWYQKDGPL